MRKTVAERLEAKTDRSCGPDRCWPWLGARTRGYGIIRITGNLFLGAHVAALCEATGEAPNGRDALHSCDNPPCCNPAHLSWGTPADNAKDMVSRKRQARGERAAAAKLTEAQVAEIRRAYKPGNPLASQPALGRAYGVHASTIGRIVTGAGWRI